MLVRWWLAGLGVVAAAIWGANAAQAQFYFGAEGGWTNLENATDTLSQNTEAALFFGPPSVSKRRTFSDGFNVGARVGYRWGAWRLEEEYSYRENGSRALPLDAVLGIATSGTRTSNAILTNLLYDFTFGWPVTPHLGVGIGAVEQTDSVKAAGIGRISDSSNWEFGYQGIAGLRYEFAAGFALDLDYRYLATTDPSFRSKPYTLSSAAVAVLPVPGIKYKSEYGTHNLVASLTWSFAPPPPMPPVAAPAVAPAAPPARREYLVFFDWDKATITPEGLQIVRQAAAAYRAGGSVRIQVIGFTDLSGSAGYNLRLSERRAGNVAAALAGMGVARNDMVVAGRGMNNPRVPTALGVREPQNRRVEIVFP